MIDLAVIYSEEFKKHYMDRAHPESPERLDIIIKGVEELQHELKDKIEILAPIDIKDEELLAVHVPDLLQKIEAISTSGGGMITIDTTLNEFTYKAARLAAGATKLAAQLVEENKAKKSFAVVRPPGHHAETNSAGGFCYFNNIAIAAQWLITKKGLNRIAIIDIDHHFGNGTSHIFYHRKDVLYVSLHAHPKYSYPGSGYPTEVGIAEGLGYNVNIPLLPGTQGIDWLHTLNFGLDIVKQYKPEAILISAGFDALGNDPVGILDISPNAFQGAGYLLQKLANEYCEGRISSALEGGYKIDQLRDVANRFLKGILGYKNSIIEQMKKRGISDYTQSILNQVKKAHREYWKF